MTAALILLLFCIPPHFGNDLYALPKAALACVVVLVAFWREAPSVWPTDPRPWAYLAAALAVSTLLSWDLGYSLVSVEHSRGLGLLQWAVCGLLFLYGCNAGRERVDLAVLYGGGLMAAGALLQRVALPGRASWGSTQGSPVVLGEMLAVCFPVAWRLHPALAALFVAAAVAAHCRSALLAMGISAVYLWRTR